MLGHRDVPKLLRRSGCKTSCVRTIRRLRARRALMLFNDVPLRFENQKDASAIILCTAIAPFWFSKKEISLNRINALLALNWRFYLHAYFYSVNKMTSDFSGIHGLLEEPEQELLFDVRKFRANKEVSSWQSKMIQIRRFALFSVYGGNWSYGHYFGQCPSMQWPGRTFCQGRILKFLLFKIS